MRERLDKALSHHPDLPAFAADVFRVRGVRVCIGCATTFPLFGLGITWLTLTNPSIHWAVALGGGTGMAMLQGVSSLGWTRWRWLKFVVKANLGMGLALAVHGVLSAPWPGLAKTSGLLAFLALAQLSTIPRRRRMHAAAGG